MIQVNSCIKQLYLRVSKDAISFFSGKMGIM